MKEKSYPLHKGIGRPLQFKGLQAQYVTYLGIGSVAELLVFAVMYVAKVNAYLCVVLTLGGFGALLYFVYALSKKYGTHGLMKKMARRRIPKGISTGAFDERLPIRGMEDGLLVSRGGDVSLAYSLTLPEIFTLSEEQFNALHDGWVKAIGTLPPHSILHKQDWFFKARFYAKAGMEEERSYLSLASDRYFRERPYLEHDCFLFLTLRADENRRPSSALSSLLKGTNLQSRRRDHQDIQLFVDAAFQFCRILTDTGLMQIDRLSDKEMLGAPGGPGILERYCCLGKGGDARTLRDLSFEDGIKVGNKHCKLFTLADDSHLPFQCAPSAPNRKYSTDGSACHRSFATILGPLLDTDHLYNQYIFVEEAQNLVSELERKKLRLQSLSLHSRENGVARDAVDTFLQEAAKEQRLPVKAHFNVLAWGDEKEQLREIRSRVGAAFSQMNANLKEETLGAPRSSGQAFRVMRRTFP